MACIRPNERGKEEKRDGAVGWPDVVPADGVGTDMGIMARGIFSIGEMRSKTRDAGRHGP